MRLSQAASRLQNEFDLLGIWYRHHYIVELKRIGARRLSFVLKARGRWIALIDNVAPDGKPDDAFLSALKKHGYRIVFIDPEKVAENARGVARKIVREIKPDTRVKRDAEARRLIRAAIGKHLPRKGAAA